MATIRRNLLLSPTFSNRGGAEASSEFSSLTEMHQLNLGNELICDECHCPKRHPDMTWWWDEQCTITVCEHCCMSNHRLHSLKPQEEAEHEEMQSYEKFLLDNQKFTAKIFEDIVKQREMLQKVGLNLGEMKGLGDVVKDFVEKYQTKLSNIEKEILLVKYLRLTSETYRRRNEIRRLTKEILNTVDEAMNGLAPHLDKLVKKFDGVKSILNKWDRDGMTTLESAGGDT